MDQKADKLIPGAALIYERIDDVVYARYRDPPHNSIPRWIVGGDASACAKARGQFLYEWAQLCELASEYPALEKQLSKTMDLYYLIKDKQ